MCAGPSCGFSITLRSRRTVGIGPPGSPTRVFGRKMLILRGMRSLSSWLLRCVLGISLATGVLVAGSPPAWAADDYPHKNAVDCSSSFGIYSWCINGNWYSSRLFAYRNCTDWVAWRLAATNGVAGFNNNYGGRRWGNANTWDDTARALGIPVNSTPARGAVAQTDAGSFGHVAWVSSVNGDGTVTVEEYNRGGKGEYSLRTASATSFVYIHVRDLASWPPPEGTFVSVQESGMVFRVAGGAPIYVSSWDAVGGPQPTMPISQSQLEALRKVPADGTLIAGQPSGRVFRVAGGAPLYVSSWDAIGGPQPAISVDDAAIDHAGDGAPWDHLRATPTDMFIRGHVDGSVFRVVSGHPYYVPSWDPYGGSQPFVDVDGWAIEHCDHLNCNPFGFLDSAKDAGDRVRLSGWAMDPNTTDSIGVHVYIDDKYAGAGSADRSRPDVDAAFHRGERFGFDFGVATPVGVHRVCVYGLNRGAGGNDLIGCASVRITEAPRSTTPPTIAGSPRVANTVRCDPGNWKNTDHFAFAWTSNGETIAGASSASYRISEGHYGRRLACRVTGRNAVASTTARSVAEVVAAGPALTTTIAPKVSGKARVGKALTASRGVWSPAAKAYRYQWRRSGRSIKGATRATYKLVKADRRKSITCRVTATRRGWKDGVFTPPAKRVR